MSLNDTEKNLALFLIHSNQAFSENKITFFVSIASVIVNQHISVQKCLFTEHLTKSFKNYFY